MPERVNKTEVREGLAKITCAIILNVKKEVLLVKRGKEPHKGEWALSGGVGSSAEAGLTPDEAVIDEVNFDLGTKSFRGERVLAIPVENNKVADEILVYVGTINESEIVIRPGHSEGTRWVTLEEAARMPLAFGNENIIKKYLELKDKNNK